MDRRTAFLALRWVAILALWLHVIYNRAEPPWNDARVWTVIMTLVLSNVVLGILRAEAFHRHRLFFYTFLLDLILVSVAVYLADAEGISFFIMLVLCIFTGAVAGDVRVSSLVAILASVIYLAQLRISLSSFVELADPSMLMRVPLLLVFALTASNLSNNSDRRRLRKASTLLEFDKQLLVHQSQDEIASALLEALRAHGSHCRRAAFYLFDTKERILRRIGDPELPERLFVDRMPEILLERWRRGRPITPEHLGRATEWCRVQRLVAPATFLVPAMYSQRPQGMLVVEHRRQVIDVDAHTDILQSLADRAASALINARLIETAQESAIGLHSLLKMSEAVSSSLRAPEILQLLQESCNRLLKVRSTQLFLAKRRTGTPTQLVSVRGSANRLSTVAARQAFDNGAPVHLASRDSVQALVAIDEHEGVDNLVAMPLKNGGRVVGVIEAIDKPGGFSNRDLALLSGLASQAAVALENARLYASMEDRAERIEAMAAVLEKEKRKLEHVLANMEEGVILLTDKGVTLINHAGRRLLAPLGPVELPAAESVFADPLGLLPQLRVALETRSSHHDVLAAEERFLSLQAVCISSDDDAGAAPGSAGVIAVVGDITELVRLGEKRSEFVSQVSHELRTPLSAIVGAVKLLAEGRAGTLSETQARLLNIAEKESDHLMVLINDLLDLAKGEAGVMEVDQSEVSLSELLEDAAESMSGLADDKNVALEVDTSDLSGPTFCDPVRIRQVVLNLVGNAIKFTAPGGSVRLIGDLVEGAPRVRVVDTGTGIPADKLNLIFEKFEQLGPSNARAKGTGLGLAIARHIVQSHGGTIGVESEEGIGSTFHFTLPAGQVTAAPLEAKAA